MRHMRDVGDGLGITTVTHRELSAAMSVARGMRTSVLADVNVVGMATINYGHGHEAGDEVLTTVAARLHVAAPQALISRSGDQFRMLWLELGMDAEEAVAQLRSVDLGPSAASGQSADLNGWVGVGPATWLERAWKRYDKAAMREPWQFDVVRVHRWRPPSRFTIY